MTSERAARPVNAIGNAILSFEGDDAGPLGHSHLWFCQCSDTSIPRHDCLAAAQSPTPPEGLRAAVALIAADWFDTGYENGRLDHGVLADRLFAALAASPAPDPGAMREALERIEHLTRPYPLAETGWPQRYPPIAATEEAHAVAVAALTPSAEPPETTG